MSANPPSTGGHHVQFNNNEGFETNFDDNFGGGEVNYPSINQQQEPQEQQHQSGLIAGNNEEQAYYDNNTPEQQVYYTDNTTTTSTTSTTSTTNNNYNNYANNNNYNNNNLMMENKQPIHYVPSIIPEDIRHQYGINALTLDQIHRSIFVSLNTPIEMLSVQELSNFFSFCGSVEKIIMVDDLNGAVVCLENNESFSTSLLLNEMKLNEKTQLYIFNLCDLIGIPRKKTATASSSLPYPNQSYETTTTPSSQLAIQGLFQEGFIQSKHLFEQLKSKAIKLDQENDITKKVQYSLNYSKDQWIKFAKQMNENVESVKLTFIPIRESFNLQTVSQRAEQLNTQTQQYFSYIKTRAKELGKDLNEKIKQQDQKTQFTAKIKDMKIEENLSKAGEAVAKNWSAMTSFIKGQVQKVSSNGSSSNSNSSGYSSASNSYSYNNNNNNQYNQHEQSYNPYYGNNESSVDNYYSSTTSSSKSLPPLPNKNKQQITSLEEDDSMWSSGNTQQQPQYSLDTNEDDDFPVEYQNTTTTTTTNNNNNITTHTNTTAPTTQSADSFFD